MKIAEHSNKELMKKLYYYLLGYGALSLGFFIILIFKSVKLVQRLNGISGGRIVVLIFGAGFVVYFLFHFIKGLKDLFTVKKIGLVEYKGKVRIKEEFTFSDSPHTNYNPVIRVGEKEIVLKYNIKKELFDPGKEYCFLYLKHTRFAVLHLPEEQVNFN